MTVHWQPIPGETPIDDISGLIPKHVRSRRELAVVEGLNIHEAVVKYLALTPGRRQAPFDLPWAIKLHKEMFGKVWTWAGVCRTVELNIGLPFHQINMQLQSLLDDLIYWRDQTQMPVIEQASRLHHRSVLIHPFLNGNGRWSRLLANIWLKQRGQQPVEWPEQTIGIESIIRNEYLTALRQADSSGDYAPLIALHSKYQR